MTLCQETIFRIQQYIIDTIEEDIIPGHISLIKQLKRKQKSINDLSPEECIKLHTSYKAACNKLIEHATLFRDYEEWWTNL